MKASIRQLEVLVEIYRFGNMTRAAERLGLTQSAVSLHLQQLEALYGLRLFDRTTRVLYPTDAAKRAVATAERILATMSGLTGEMQSLTKLGAGRLVMVTSAGFASTILPTALTAFAEAHPKLEIVFYDVPAHQVVDRLLSTEAEFALGNIEGDIPDVTVESVLKGKLSVVGIERGPFAERKSISWEELSSFRTISMRRETRMRAAIELELAKSGRTFTPTYEVSLFNSALSLSAAGLGVSILPDFTLIPDQFPTLVAKPLIRPVMARQISLIRKTGRSLSPASATFVAFVRRELAKAKRLREA